MISSSSALYETIRRYNDQCQAELRGQTDLSGESLHAMMLKGPYVELYVKVRNVIRGHALLNKSELSGFTLSGMFNTKSPSLIDRILSKPIMEGPPVIAFFEGVSEENKLFSLRPEDFISVGGFATIGLAGKYYENDYDKKRTFGLSESRLI